MLIALRFRRVSSGQYPPLLLLPLFDVAPPPCEFPSDGHPVKAIETSMRTANNSLVAFIVISCERDRRALPDYWLRHVSYSLEAVTVCLAGFLRLVHAGNKIDVLGIAGVLSQRPIRGAESTRRVAGLRIVNVRRSHDIPFGAVSGWRWETDFVFAASSRR
jgi:hypothetical protein